MTSVFPYWVVGGFCSVLALQSTAAETTQSPVTLLNKVVVSASRVEQTAQKETRAIDSVDRRQLDEIQPLSVADALKFDANVTVAGGPVPGGQSVNIRGLEGNKVLQIIDGTRVNTNFDHRPSYFLDPALINNIDVVKGPVSSLWGSGAIGGVVSQRTLTADDLIVEGKSLGGFIKGGYSDNGDQWTTTVVAAGKQGVINWLVAGSYLDSEPMEQGNGNTLYGSETQNTTGLAKFNWQINTSSTIGLNYRHADNDGHPPVVGSSDQQVNGASSLIDRETTDEHFSINYRFNPAGDRINIDSRLYQNNTRIEETNLNAGLDVSDIETLGFSVTNQSSLEKLNLLGGIDGYEDSLDAIRPDAGNGDGRPNPPTGAKTTTIGAFLYGDYPLGESVVLEAGVRYDSFKSEAQGYDDSDESALSPSMAVRWQLRDWAALSLRYDEAFRAPDVYELFMDGTHFAFFPGGPTNVFVPNPELEPETSSNVELKGEFEFDDVFGEDKLRFVASLFDNKVDDFIQLSVTVPDTMPGFCFAPGMGVGCAGNSMSENVANARLKGFELAAVYQLDALTASLSYGQTRGEDSDSGDELANIPADKWVASIDYGFWSVDTKAGVRAIKSSDQDRIPSDDTQGPYKGYTTVDFYVSWEPADQQLEGIKVDVTVANAFDQNYRTAWSSVYELGRSVRVAAQYRF